VGQFSRGKTTLMNALLGGSYLPMGALPMTSVITTIRYGSQPRAMVRRRASDLRVEVPLADVAEFVSSSSAGWPGWPGWPGWQVVTLFRI
jgi:GTPase SAR1 family protein